MKPRLDAGRPLVGYLPEFRRDPLGLLESVTRRHGPLAWIRVGGRDVYIVNEPECVQDILVTHARKFIKSRTLQRARQTLLGGSLLTLDGVEHLRRRRLAQPAFHRDRLAGYAQTMRAQAEWLRQSWQESAEVNMGAEMMRLTLAIVGRTLFSADVDGDSTGIGQAMTDVVEMFDTVLMPFANYLERFPFLPVTRRLKRARRRLDDVIYRIIGDRRRSGIDGDDLLGLLMSARDEADGSALTDVELRDELLTIFLAGHETTALALTWSWYLLARNRDVEARFHAAVDSGDRDFVERVFAEALRLYPPAWAIGRISIEPYELAGHPVEPGAVFVLSPWLMHRDARFWPDPLRFDPDRFLPANRDQRPRCSYYPFGAGPRACIGERFAWLEAALLLSVLGCAWQPRLARNASVDVNPLITLRPRTPVRMILQRRPLTPRPHSDDRCWEARQEDARAEGREQRESDHPQL